MTVLSSIRIVLVALLLSGAPVCRAVENLRIIIPDASGSPLDTAGRELGHALATSGGAINVRYENLPGAGGVIGLARFADSAKGDPAALLLGDSAMAASIVRNRSGVTFTNVTAIARLTFEPPPGREWRGVFAAPGITSAQRDELMRAVEKAAHATNWRGVLATLKWHEAWLPGEAFGAFIAAQMRGAQPP